MKKIVCVILLSICLAGCGSQVMSLPTPAPANSDQVVGHCSNADGGFLLFSFIPIYNNGRLERAYKKCLDSVNANSLTNVTVVDRWFWTPAGNGFVTIVEGDGVR